MVPLKRKKIYVSFETPGDKKQINGNINVVTSSVQYFFNSQHLLVKLGKARPFYDFLCECMDNSNKITINNDFSDHFIEHISKITSKKSKIKKASVQKYVSTLSELGLIILVGNKRSGFYLVNPKYVFKGSKSIRLKLIKNLVTKRGSLGLPLKGLIDVPEEEFLEETKN